MFYADKNHLLVQRGCIFLKFIKTIEIMYLINWFQANALMLFMTLILEYV